MSLPAGMIQMDIFEMMQSREAEKKPKRKPKGTVYRCDKCGKSIVMNIPAIVIVCGCGRVMQQEE
ncbi:hypothetical protein [Thermoactinomyces sp. CICC 10521]|uniref:hypothetical protein n=1 Tax=Thermoactinomyces sp. CICC 10521 TaxID=2767426 RepID=UPI0018DB42A2|nr:hypothetical protein [Thermoactinomyces sp. CICC 10521]MBH8606010.1 hypothetical protein [Thermoactinomyces sp. CICC 10521]